MNDRFSVVKGRADNGRDSVRYPHLSVLKRSVCNRPKSRSSTKRVQGLRPCPPEAPLLGPLSYTRPACHHAGQDDAEKRPAVATAQDASILAK